MVHDHFISINQVNEFVNKKSFRTSEYLNLPDLQFFLWCQHQYKLNKGVYNTIDTWFYKNGIVSIIHRRIYILAFLDFVKKPGQQEDPHKYIQFGNGGLTKKLYQFFRKIDKKEYDLKKP